MELQTFHLEAVLDFAVAIALPEAKTVISGSRCICLRQAFHWHRESGNNKLDAPEIRALSAVCERVAVGTGRAEQPPRVNPRPAPGTERGEAPAAGTRRGTKYFILPCH